MATSHSRHAKKLPEKLTALGAKTICRFCAALKNPYSKSDCAQAAIKAANSSVLLMAAACRLVAIRKPTGAAEVLLAYLPCAPDEAVVNEVRAALAAVAMRDGKPEVVLLQASGKQGCNDTLHGGPLCWGEYPCPRRKQPGAEFILSAPSLP